MDRFKIQGGRKLEGTVQHQRREERGAAGDGCGAANGRARFT